MLERHDPGCASHSRRVGALAAATALRLGLPRARAREVRIAGELHDLGKLVVAPEILHKPGRLTTDEWRQIRRHPAAGARMLSATGLAKIAGWVRAHHERMDGGGYPDGLRGAEIPLEARILAVSDAYEAMRAPRAYGGPLSHVEAGRELARCTGSQFDAEVVKAFVADTPAARRVTVRRAST